MSIWERLLIKLHLKKPIDYNSIEYMIYDILKWTKKNNISFINGFNFPYEKKYIKSIEKKFKDILIFKQNPDKYKKHINN